MGKKIFLVPPYASTLLLVHCWVASLTLAMSSASWADEYALLALKAHITNDPNNILATNWSNITFYCNWTGVSCNTPQQRVIALNLSSMGLEGTIAPQVGNLSFLISLDISNNNFRGRLPAEIGKLHRLQILSVQDNQLSSQIPSGLDKCGDLRQISLSYNRFTGIIPRGIGNLSKLEVFYLSQNNLTGEIPESLFNVSSLKIFRIGLNKFSGTLPTGMCYTLPRLQFIAITFNQLEGELPSSLSHCQELQVLSLARNQFTGSIPKEMGNLSMLEKNYLGNNNLTGEIPQALFNISSLRVFSIENNIISGNLPKDMCSVLPTLEILSLSWNQIKGEIPSSLPHCRELQMLSLLYNQFTGSIPNEIGNLSNLQEIYLGANRLTGIIPPSFGNLSMLKELSSAYNNIGGEIPQEFGHLFNLQCLNLGSNNLTGVIPKAIFNISSLQFLSLAINHLSGILPSTMGLSLPNLQSLYLDGNEFSGTIPTSISNISKLTTLALSINFFTGYVPMDLGNLRQLQSLFLGSNNLTNEPLNPELSFLNSLTNCKFLTQLRIENNPLNGMLPNSFSNLSISLTTICAASCQIKGMIPRGIGNFTNLIELSLGDNDLIGSIPTSIGRMQKLQALKITRNRLHRSIPSALCGLKNLAELYLSSNKLSGSIPSCVGNLSALRKLYLDSNAFTSKIPSSLWTLGDLLLLNLSSNFLNSYLPLEVGNMKHILELDLSNNQFSIYIPSTMGQLQSLQKLSLSRNKFQGPIPQTFGGLMNLESLDLSWNNLSGAIPKSLEALVYLKYLNVSFNNLQGAIPDKGPFANFTGGSFMSNDALCGAPRFQVKACDIGTSKSPLLKYVLPSFVSTIIILVILVALLIRCQNKRSKIPPVEAGSSLLVTHKSISYQELLYATFYFSEDFLVGKGSLGMVYKGVLSDGLAVAIKVFNVQLQEAFKSFDIECEVMRNIRHRNLVKIITSCSNHDFKALVLEYMPNGSLEKWLYSHNFFLDMVQRLNIMIDVASALEYLHHDYSTPIVHCDLKPSNVLLDKDMVAYVGDFGIAKLLAGNESIVQTKTLGTIGYMAPEYGSGGIVSTRGDVYSYGIMLMETFTRKKPTDDMFFGELSLKSWVESLASTVMEVVDANLLRREDEHFAAKENCVLSIMALALECTTKSPEQRITMKEVVARLKKIRIKLLV